jgi:D-arabinose 1-dehydrogenase-like Zn-dependent alcohol dehydrogenase
MRAAVIEEFNQPWQVRDVPDPKAGAGQVVVKVHASGMCFTDLHAHHGVFPLKPPFVAGHEPAGVIVEVGAGVTDLRVGDRVGVFWNQKGCGRCAVCQAGRGSACPDAQSWMHLGGSNAEFMLAWASGCALIPDGVSFEAAAPMFCAGYTTMSGLRNADPKPGERVAVLGVGGLGHLALQLAKATIRARRCARRAAPTSSCRRPTPADRSRPRSRACAPAGGSSTWVSPTAGSRSIR